MPPRNFDELSDNLPDENLIISLADLFKVFGDPTRLKIMKCLEKQSLFVGEIAGLLGMSLSAVSHQLRILRSSKLVKAEKLGKEVRYSLDDEHVTQIVNIGLTHISEEPEI